MKETCGSPICNNICKEQPARCSKCESTPYCSRDCQKQHWKQHKKICAFLNAGPAQQLHHTDHERELIDEEIHSTVIEQLVMYPHAVQEMYRLFKSTPKEEEEKHLACRVERMTKLSRTLDERTKEEFMHALVIILARTKSWLIEKPTSPLLILFQVGVNADALSTNKRTRLPDETSYTCLCQISQLSSTTNSLMTKNQLILGRQFLEVGGADVNAHANWGLSCCFPLYNACASPAATNTKFIQLLLEHGADPNKQNNQGETPLMNTLNCAVGAGIQLLSFEHYAVPIDVNLRRYDGCTVLGMVNGSILSTGGITVMSPQQDYIVSQLLEFKALLEARGAVE